jgi:hypothetical protein
MGDHIFFDRPKIAISAKIRLFCYPCGIEKDENKGLQDFISRIGGFIFGSNFKISLI